MEPKQLNWRNFLNKYGYMTKEEYRADVKVNGLFGIRYQYGKRYDRSYYYYYIINGKKFGDYNGFDCSSLEEGKRLCEEKYKEICNQIIDTIFK